MLLDEAPVRANCVSFSPWLLGIDKEVNRAKKFLFTIFQNTALTPVMKKHLLNPTRSRQLTATALFNHIFASARCHPSTHRGQNIMPTYKRTKRSSIKARPSTFVSAPEEKRTAFLRINPKAVRQQEGNFYPPVHETEEETFSDPFQDLMANKTPLQAAVAFPKLLGIPAAATPELLGMIARMNPGQALLLAEQAFPAYSFARRYGIPVIDCSDTNVSQLLDVVLQMMPIEIGEGNYPVVKLVTKKKGQVSTPAFTRGQVQRALARSGWLEKAEEEKVVEILYFKEFRTAAADAKAVLVTGDLSTNSSLVVKCGRMRIW